MDIEELVRQIGNIQVAVFLAGVLGILLLVLYRRAVSNELEPIPVALTAFGLVETLVVTIGKEPIPRLGLVALFVLIVVSVLLILQFAAQRRLTDRRIEDVLTDPLYLLPDINPHDSSVQLEIRKWVSIGQAMLDVDIFPNSPLEAALGVRAERRERFWQALPDTIFNKANAYLLPDTFIIPVKRRRPLKVVYYLCILFSLLALALLFGWVIPTTPVGPAS